MKKLLSIMSIAASMVFVSFGLASAISPIHYDQMIKGENDPSLDIPAVQAAVDQGGKILLQGTFNFGNSRVLIRNKADGTQNEVEIYGVTDKNGNPLTEIIGGFWTFLSPLPVIPGSPPSLPDPLPPGPKITIKGIHFEGALWAPIHIAYSSGATMTGNMITGVVPYGPIPYYYQGGILYGTVNIQPAAGLPESIYREGAITGSLEISNNYIDLDNEIPQNTLGIGIFVNWTTGINATISDNIIKKSSKGAIEMLDNYCDGAGGFVVEGNEVEIPQVGMLPANPFTPEVIASGWFLNPDEYSEANICPSEVISNSIRMKGETSVGISVGGYGPIVRNNHVLSEGALAAGLYVLGSYGYIAHNKIEGTGNYAIYVHPSPLIPAVNASNNFFQGNNYNLFDAGLYDLHFAEGSNYNIFVGHSGDVLDEGIGNEITNE